MNYSQLYFAAKAALEGGELARGGKLALAAVRAAEHQWQVTECRGLLTLFSFKRKEASDAKWIAKNFGNTVDGLA